MKSKTARRYLKNNAVKVKRLHLDKVSNSMTRHALYCEMLLLRRQFKDMWEYV